jgi:hypothetical protein
MDGRTDKEETERQKHKKNKGTLKQANEQTDRCMNNRMT